MFFLAFVTFLTFSSNSTFAQEKPQDLEIKIYLIANDDNGKLGKKIGCDDSLVPVTKTIKNTATPLKSAIEELLIIPQDYDKNPDLHNYWKGDNLKVASAVIKNGVATIKITGELSVAGICDEPRIKSQIEETAKQFSEVKTVKVFVNGVTLAKAVR